MVTVLNEVIDSSEWVKRICGISPDLCSITLKELDHMRREEEKNGITGKLSSHWDYPLDEIPEIIETSDDGYKFVIVSFVKDKDVLPWSYEHRICEL